MDDSQARTIMATYLRDVFGSVLDLRQVRVLRRASGRTWQAELVCVTRFDEIPIGHLAVHEDGRIVETCTKDDLVESIRAYCLRSNKSLADGSVDPFADLELTEAKLDSKAPPVLSIPSTSDDLDEIPASVARGLDLRKRVKILKATGRREDLLAAREMLPQLLTEGETRRFTLVELGEIELRLGSKDIALQYLEAAAREFADRAEIRALELVASITVRVIGNEAFETHLVKQLLDLSKRRLQPIEHLGQAPVFAGLGREGMEQIERLANDATFEQGQVLLMEGTEAVRAFVVRSGILSIRLQAPDGGSRVVRCCVPGDLVGETSVLGEPGETCTATVRAECPTTVWVFNGASLRALGEKMPMVMTRLEGSRAIRRLDSFLSMHQTTQTLDARMRDRILSCVTGLRRTKKNEILNSPGSVPQAVYLVAEGAVEYSAPSGTVRLFESDAWIGLRDALHRVPTEGIFVSSRECLLVAFDPTRLREFASEAPPDVISIFERLE